jgi:hypothetical protein
MADDGQWMTAISMRCPYFARIKAEDVSLAVGDRRRPYKGLITLTQQR